MRLWSDGLDPETDRSPGLRSIRDQRSELKSSRQSWVDPNLCQRQLRPRSVDRQVLKRTTDCKDQGAMQDKVTTRFFTSDVVVKQRQSPTSGSTDWEPKDTDKVVDIFGNALAEKPKVEDLDFTKYHVGVVVAAPGEDSDEESDFSVQSDAEKSDDSETLDSEGEYLAKKTRPTERISWDKIPLEATGLVTFADRVEHERRVQYRKHAEQVKGWLDTVDVSRE